MACVRSSIQFFPIFSSAELSGAETLAREVRPFSALPPDAADAEKLIVTLDETRELEDGIRAVPAWRFLLGKM